MRSIWLSKLNEDNTDVVNLDVTFHMDRATLDIIGLAGSNEFTGISALR